MPFVYDAAPQEGSLRQGELLRAVTRHTVDHPASKIYSSGNGPNIISVLHPLAFVLNSDCDLNWDYDAREPATGEGYADAGEIRNSQRWVPHVFLCDAYYETEIRNRPEIGRNLWERVKKNQVERFHFLCGAVVNRDDGSHIDDLCLDFKRTFAIPTPQLYGAINNGSVERVAVILPPYLQHLTHRFYGFHSRVGVPET